MSINDLLIPLFIGLFFGGVVLFGVGAVLLGMEKQARRGGFPRTRGK